MEIIKVYEAKTLFESVATRAEQHKELKGQLNQLKHKFTNLVNNDQFLGNGATAIKSFYQAQIDVVDEWISFINQNIAFLEGIEGTAEEQNLAGETVVKMPFLEEDLAQSNKRAYEIVDQQKADLQTIFDGISDLISLNVFSSETFETYMDDAEKKRTQAIQKVNGLDGDLLSEYAVTEEAQTYIFALYSQLIEATRQGENISPLYFNAKAYKTSEIYQLKDEMDKKGNDYLTFKKEQNEEREVQKEIEAQANKPWYEKTWDTTKTFTGEITGYYDYKRATEGVDPVTGRKLSEAERIAAGAMAAAGFIPFVGWAGRAFKGGKAIYSTAKGINAASHALDAYKTSKSLSILEKSEMGIYGLVAANGMSEAVTGKDMFGNQLTEEQRQNSLLTALGIGGVAGAAKYVDHLQVKNAPYQTNDMLKGNKGTGHSIKEISKVDRAKLDGWKYPPKDEKYLKYKKVYDNPIYYNQETGDINWPPNNGFLGEPIDMELKKGDLIDRYGGPQGNFFSQKGIPYEQRALALHSDEADYYVYRILEDFEVKGGKAARWFDRPGGGIQFIKYHDNGKMYTIEELEREELIELVEVREYGTH